MRVFLKFVLVNGLNTALYWGLYVLFLLVSPYFVANALALVIAVLVAYVANARFAFDVSTSRRSLLMYAVANGLTVVLRMAVVWVLVTPLGCPESIVPPAAVALTMPFAYVLTRWALAERRTVPAPTTTYGGAPARVAG